MDRSNPIKRIFELYTSDLSFDEVERLIKRDAADVYEYFSSDIPKPDESKNKFTRFLIFTRSLFNAFLLKLTPARRLFYFLAVLIFIIGIAGQNNLYLIVSFLLLNLLIAFELADKLISKNELELARKIQSSLIPKPPFEDDNYEISALYVSAKEVGGDYFDIIDFPDDNRKMIVVGDISGKGIAAALYMVRVQAIFSMLAGQIKTVKNIVINVKKYFSQKLEREFFLTISAASVEKDGTLKICRAGHPPALFYKAEKDEIEQVNSKGIGIGLNDKGVFEKSIEERKIKPVSGDVILFYSDGLTEAMNEIKLQFGTERVEKIIKKNHEKSAEAILGEINKSVEFFMGNAPRHDDITIVILKRK